MNTFICPKCSSAVTEVCSGYSNSDEKGASYTYTRCVLCGFVRHHLNGVEMREHCKITGSGKTGVNVVRDRIMCIPRAKINVF